MAVSIEQIGPRSKKLKNTRRKNRITLGVLIIPILILIATLGLRPQIEKMKLKKIVNDINTVGDIIKTYIAETGGLSDDWDDTNIKYLKSIKNALYDEGGLIQSEDVIQIGAYKVIPRDFIKIESKFRGVFYTSDTGKIYYEDTGTHNKSSDIENNDEIDSLIEQGWVPVASAVELQQINNNTDELQVFGAGTKWEGSYVGNLNSRYIQIKDISLGDCTDWVPIGQSTENPFTGKYNGMEHNIDNLNITDNSKWEYKELGTSESVGLFGVLDGDAELKNINIRMCRIKLEKHKDTNNKDVNVSIGCLVGMIYNGDVNISSINISNFDINSMALLREMISEGVTMDIGALVGTICDGRHKIDDINILDGEISHTEESSKNFSVRLGGLVGYNKGYTYISNTGVNAIITGNRFEDDNKDKSVGGLIGHTAGYKLNIENVNIQGEVVGSDCIGTTNNSVGGLLGISETGLLGIENATIMADVIGNENIGGLIGKSVGSIVNIRKSVIDNNIVERIHGKDAKNNKNIGGIIGADYGEYIELMECNVNSNIEYKFNKESIETGMKMKTEVKMGIRMGSLIGHSTSNKYITNIEIDSNIRDIIGLDDNNQEDKR